MDIQLDHFWEEVLKLIKAEVTEVGYTTWIQPISLKSIENNCITLLVDDDFLKNTLEKRYMPLIKNSIYHVLNNSSYEIKLILSTDIPIITNTVGGREKSINDKILNISLNPNYTFAHFVIGESNKLAHAASVAVAEAPAKAYNPLFIYGGSGLGKTHLMHAIGHHILEQNKNINVFYVTSETFTNDLINSIKDDKNEGFRKKYRNVDVLMIDDIQFLANKVQTQEEFFHTFNALHQSNKQIIISSDRPPKEIPTLEDRLRNRFEGGLLADIAPPDFETRVAILRKKAEIETIDIPDSVLNLIARSIQSNIRELEGALIKVVAYSSLTGEDITDEFAIETIKDIVSGEKPETLTPEYIKHVVSDYFSMKIEDFSAKKRIKSFVYPRQIAMYLCREMTDISLFKIGEAFNREHTTIIYAHDKIKEDMKNDESLKLHLKEIMEKLST